MRVKQSVDARPQSTGRVRTVSGQDDMMMCQGGEPVRSAMSAMAVMGPDVLL